MKKFLQVFSLFFVAVLTLCQTACSPKGTSIDLFFFNTAIHIETHDKQISESTLSKLNTTLSYIDQTFDAHDRSSVIFAVNQADENQPINVPIRVIDLLKKSAHYNEFSSGKFSHTLYPLINAWSFYDYPKLNFAPPSQEAIDNLLSSGALSPLNLHIDEQDLTVTKTHKDTKIDLGGIVKGYAIDLLSEILLEDGHTKGYINVGGSSIYLLSVDNLTIKHPRMSEKKPTVIKINGQNVKNTAVSTSGDYQRFYDYDGKIYSHILDSETGFPIATNVISATLLCDDSAFCDAMTTALCCYNYYPHDHDNSPLIKFANKILLEKPTAFIYVVFDDGQNQLLITNATDKDFTLLDGEYQIVRI